MSQFETPIMRDITKILPPLLLGSVISLGIFFVLPIMFTVDFEKFTEYFINTLFNFDLLLSQLFWGVQISAVIVTLVRLFFWIKSREN